MFVSYYNNGAWQEASQLNDNINFYYQDQWCEMRFNESSSPTFSQDGRKMYFSRIDLISNACEGYGSFCISELTTGIEDENPEMPSTISLSAYPNPFNTQTRIVYDGDKGELKEIAIYSITGQKVKSFAPAAEILWDGNDMRGNDASSGLYFVVAGGINNKVVTKVTLLR